MVDLFYNYEFEFHHLKLQDQIFITELTLDVLQSH